MSADNDIPSMPTFFCKLKCIASPLNVQILTVFACLLRIHYRM